jgi:hypothetical protein
MNVDVEFFNIVNELGPLGDIDLASYESHPATSSKDQMSSGCGCGTGGGDSCCGGTGTALAPPTAPGLASPNAAAQSAPYGPDDRRVTLYPKWDPGTRAWWTWDEAKATWVKTA